MVFGLWTSWTSARQALSVRMPSTRSPKISITKIQTYASLGMPCTPTICVLVFPLGGTVRIQSGDYSGAVDAQHDEEHLPPSAALSFISAHRPCGSGVPPPVPAQHLSMQ